MARIVEGFLLFCIAEMQIACRYLLALAVLAVLASQAPPAAAQAWSGVAGRGHVASAAPASPAAAPANLPHLAYRLRAADLGLIVNTADPYPEAVGALYARRRGLLPAQVLRLALPVRPALTVEEFNGLRRAIAGRFGARIQALVLAWSQPYAVACNSISGALALGFDAGLCRDTCSRPARASPMFNAAGVRPWSELGMRPSMLLAARSVEEAAALIERGAAADATLGRRGAPPARALFLKTSDAVRGVRELLYPQPGLVAGAGVEVVVAPAATLAAAERVVLVVTGSERVELAARPRWLPGALADHLTSFGGSLADPQGQTSALDWIASGATASHGTVSEPCNHRQKFPHPALLLMRYLQGATSLEAYWESVSWPQQSLFIGEPLAAPFAARR
jgi:uncharacterized protein (TIGR03790 family)